MKRIAPLSPEASNAEYRELINRIAQWIREFEDGKQHRMTVGTSKTQAHTWSASHEEDPTPVGTVRVHVDTEGNEVPTMVNVKRERGWERMSRLAWEREQEEASKPEEES